VIDTAAGYKRIDMNNSKAVFYPPTAGEHLLNCRLSQRQFKYKLSQFLPLSFSVPSVSRALAGGEKGLSVFDVAYQLPLLAHQLNSCFFIFSLDPLNPRTLGSFCNPNHLIT
jgi:hypothetical protein